MSDSANNLFSPAWWITAVLTGILVNIAGAYLKPRIDGYAGRVSSKWRRRQQWIGQLREDSITRMRASSEERRQARFYIHFLFMRSTQSLVFAVLGGSLLSASQVLKVQSRADEVIAVVFAAGSLALLVISLLDALSKRRECRRFSEELFSAEAAVRASMERDGASPGAPGAEAEGG